MNGPDLVGSDGTATYAYVSIETTSIAVCSAVNLSSSCSYLVLFLCCSTYTYAVLLRLLPLPSVLH